MIWTSKFPFSSNLGPFHYDSRHFRYEVVFTTVGQLFSEGNTLVLNALPQLASYSMELFKSDEEFNAKKVLPAVRGFWQIVRMKTPEQFNALLESVPGDQRDAFLAHLNQ